MIFATVSAAFFPGLDFIPDFADNRAVQCFRILFQEGEYLRFELFRPLAQNPRYGFIDILIFVPNKIFGLGKKQIDVAIIFSDRQHH
jgi:hypothetical protein